MFGKVKELDQLLESLKMNSSNNYKDAAKTDYETLIARVEELKETGKIKGRAADHYDKEIEKWASAMKNYNHQNNVKSF